jgi:uncharacterized protein
MSIPSGGNVVVLYASVYGDVPMVINLSGRFDLERGVEERLGKEFMDIINKESFIDVTDKSGKKSCLPFDMQGYLLNIQICYVYPFSFYHVYLLCCNVGKFLYRVTKESLMERLSTDMRAASLSISKECRFRH